jgi:hypothetical protein
MRFLRAHTEIYSQMASGRPLISNPEQYYWIRIIFNTVYCLIFSLILLMIVYCIINFIWCLIVMLIWADNSKKKKTKKVLVRSNLVEIGLQRKYSALYLQHNLVTSLFLDVRFHKELNNFSNYWHRETDYSYKHQEIDHVVIY